MVQAQGIRLEVFDDWSLELRKTGLVGDLVPDSEEGKIVEAGYWVV